MSDTPPLPDFPISTARWSWLPPWHDAFRQFWQRLPDGARRTLARRFPTVYLASAIPPSAGQPDNTMPANAVWGGYSPKDHSIRIAWPLAERLRQADEELLFGLIGYLVAHAYLRMAGWNGRADDVAEGWGLRVRALRRFIASVPAEDLRAFTGNRRRPRPTADDPDLAGSPDEPKPAGVPKPGPKPGSRPTPPERTPMPHTGPPPPTDGGSGRRKPDVA
jgi:hypothetical protein